MAKRALIMYFTMTGNTTKVANRFQEVFQKRGWECDVLQVTRKTNVTQSPSPFDVSKYDFFCIGSGNYKSMPGEHVIELMRNNPADIHYNSIIATFKEPGGIAGQFGPERKPGQEPLAPPPKPSGIAPSSNHQKLTINPEWKKGIVFLTFGGHEFGWAEAEPSLGALALEMGHMKVECIGKFSCPGKMGPQADNVYFKDLHTRPNEKDLMSAEIFLERVLDSLE